MEIAEEDVGEEDVPQSVVDFLEPNIPAFQNLRDIDPLIGQRMPPLDETFLISK